MLEVGEVIFLFSPEKLNKLNVARGKDLIYFAVMVERKKHVSF
jgi:hypothetical protein